MEANQEKSGEDQGVAADAARACAPDGAEPAAQSQAEPLVPNAGEYPTEQELRAAKVPWPETAEELSDYIAGLVERPHDYGTCVYAMSMAAEAAYNYVAKTLGVTGFQAGCADLDLIRRIKGWERFMFLNFGDALYPQYDLPGKLTKALEEVRPWLAQQAREKLKDTEHAHPEVVAHWRKLATYRPKAKGGGS